MPVQPTYPGVYIEELPSGVRTITGVATSITGFLGKAVRGPADQPVTITSFSDYERIFGGLHRDMTLSYAVRDFFLNGGGQAVIVRLYKATAGSAAKATYEVPNLTLQAASEGAWGMQVRARVEKKSVTDPNLIAVATRLGVAPADLFDLIVRDGGTGITETFLNLTTKESARRADRVLLAESNLVRVTTTMPSNSSPTAHAGTSADADVWTSTTKSTPAKNAAPADIAVESAVLDAAAYKGSQTGKTGLYQLEKIDLFNLLCILPDARGHGKSASGQGDYSTRQRVADLAGLIEALKLDRPVVGGHSMGADTAMGLAAEYPHLTRGVFLEDPPIILPGESLGGDQVINPDEIGKMMAKYMRMFKLMPRFVALNMARKGMPTYPDDEIQPWLDSKRRVSFDFLKAMGGALMEFAAAPLDVIRKIQSPVLLIIGDKAKMSIVSPEAAQKAAEWNTERARMQNENAIKYQAWLNAKKAEAALIWGE